MQLLDVLKKIKVMENPPMYSLCGNCKGSWMQNVGFCSCFVQSFLTEWQKISVQLFLSREAHNNWKYL